MAMSVTTTEITHCLINKLTFVWVSAADGTASGSTTAYFNGDIIGFATIPSGAAAPSDNYDITVTDGDSHDVLMGQGADRDTANTEYVTRDNLAGVADSKLTLNVSNAGDTKGGTAILYIKSY